MYILLNRINIVVDILEDDNLRYIKLQPGTNYIIACPEDEGSAVIGSDGNQHFTLLTADLANDPDAVVVKHFDEIPEECEPNTWIYDQTSDSLVYRYPTSPEKREHAYETEAIISWQGSQLTVDAANKLWSAYTAEGNVEVAQELTALISDAKQQIRHDYPDENSDNGEVVEE